MIANIDKELLSLYEEFKTSLQSLIILTQEVGQDEMETTVRDISLHLESPFMFVIVGEVKAGKSSFINSLLEADTDLCPVAPSPMTDTIQQIIYGAEHKEEIISPVFKRIYHPEDILKEISIVDTPGTNTIIAHHQEITEKFIPHADLIVFVFEAKNPYRQSAWDFFDFINQEWHKNIIFVLQQKDLLDTKDLEINIHGVNSHARKKGIPDPRVFAVSAKQEREGLSASGFDDIRSFIDQNILQANTAALKLQNQISSVTNINSRIGENIVLRQKQYELDRNFRHEITNTLDQQESNTGRQVDILSENLLASYDMITRSKLEELKQGLSITAVLKRTFSSIIGGDKGLKKWLQDQAADFELRLNKSLKSKLQEGIVDVSEDIQMMGKLVSSRISNNKTILKDSNEIFADIAERRANILSDLQRSFKDFLQNSENFYDPELIDTSGSMAPNIAAGGGIAVIGVILTAAVNGAVFDVTGGILTAVGVIFASVSVGLKRNKVLRRFREEISAGRAQIEEEVKNILKNYTSRIKQRIDANFYPLDQMLKEEKESIDSLNLLHCGIEDAMTSINSKLDKFTTS